MADGIQDQQCSDGFYGSRCQHTCPRNCKSQLCNIDNFGRSFCIDGCVDGYRGTSCKITCPVNCQVCERLNGSCINCKDTFHGTNCTLTCEEMCQGFRCDTDQTCSKTTCLDGWNGQDCSSVNQTCKDGFNTSSCSDITGGDCGKNVPLTVFVTVVLLLVNAIAVILGLWWRLHNKIIRKKRETDGEVQQPMLRAHNIRAPDPYSFNTMSSPDYGYNISTTSQDKAPDPYSFNTMSSPDYGFNISATSQDNGSVLQTCYVWDTPL